jgi:hypothetical protein
MTVPSGKSAPTYGSNVINTTGTNALWSTTNFELTGNAKLTLFFVFASSVASGYNTSCAAWIGNPNGPVGGKIIGLGIAVQGLPSSYEYYVPSTFETATAPFISQPRLVGVTTLTSAKYDGASVFGNYNGTPLAPSGLATSGGANWSALPFQTGMRYANAGGSADGFMCEVLCYNDALPELQVQQIEGYLAWKWGLQSKPPTRHPFKLTPPIMRAFQPTDVLAPTFWLDAADATTLTLSGSAITQWRDKSSNQYAGTSSGSPVQTTLNGRPAVAFNGSQVFDFGDVADLGSANLNMFVVCQFTTTGAGSVIAKSLYGDAQYRYSLLRQSESLLVLLQGDGGSAAPGVADTSTAPRVISWTWDRTTQTLYLNGTSVLSASFANTATFNSTYKLLIGGYNDGTGGTPPMSFLAFNGTIGEVLFLFGTLTSVQRQQVEGYLAQKWGLGSSLPTTHPYRSVLPSTPLFAPVSVPGLALWLDAADTTTLTLSGSNVTAWADKSGNGRNAVGTTSNPTYNATGFNSRPTVTFSNNILTSSGWSLAPNRQFAWFIVVHLTSLTNIWQRILISASVGYPNGYLGTHSSTSNILGIAGSTTITAPIATGTLSPQLVTYLFGTSELSSNTSAVSVNGGTFSTLAGNTGDIGTNGVIIGTDTGGGLGDRFLGNLSEVICYNSNVTQPQRQQVEGYLAAKWGLQARLPSTHPFAKVRP